MRRAVLASVVAVAILVLGCGALAVVTAIVAGDRTRVPSGASLSEPETVTVAEAEDHVHFRGTSPDHRVMTYALTNGGRATIVIADAVAGRIFAKHDVETAARLRRGWNGSAVEAAADVAGHCTSAVVARPPDWRFELARCTAEHGRRGGDEDPLPAPPDLRAVTQCDPSPTVKAPARELCG